MNTTIVIGGQWGDEGKAKIIDFLSQNQDVVIRYQGGSNAGHTVVANGKKYVFHIIPTGIIYPNTKCVIANGVVFDPESFFKEYEELSQTNLSLDGRIFISERAHVVMPYHKELDAIYEEESGGKIGTTKRGIGYAYADKTLRIGIRVSDLLDKERLKSLIFDAIEYHRHEYERFGKDLPNAVKITEEYHAYGLKLKAMICDTVLLINTEIDKGKNILFEGAQGAALDIDFGTYPYVTSSLTTSAGACSGSGVAPTKIKRIVGIFKAYTTRVGGGPFPSRLSENKEDELRKRGGEYGATTGRPRGCGCFDMVQARYAAMVNGFTDIALTKLDVLSGYETIEVCEAYSLGGEETKSFLPSSDDLDNAIPVIKTFKGWKEDITKCQSFDELPEAARDFILYIEKELGAKVSIISVGADREATFFR